MSPALLGKAEIQYITTYKITIKTGHKKMNENSNWFEILASLSNIDLKEILKKHVEDETYIKSTALTLGKNIQEKHIYAQFIIISIIHREIDETIDEIIRQIFYIGTLPLNNKIDTSKFGNLLLELFFMQRFNLVKSLKIFTSETYTFIKAINDIRNDFAHPRKKKDEKFKYRNKSVLTKEGLNLVITDYKRFFNERVAVMQKYVAFHEKETKNNDK